MTAFRTALLLAFLALWPSPALPAANGWFRISYIAGDAQIKTPDSEDWGLAALNQAVTADDRLWVPEGGILELQSSTGTYVRLAGGSALDILALEDRSAQLHLRQGHAYVFHDAPAGAVIQIDTPSTSSRAHDNAVFRIDISGDAAKVGVFDGQLLVENERGQRRLGHGQTLSLSADGAEARPLGEPDDWESWNNRRNARIASHSEGVSHLPEGMRSYSGDLDHNGRWARVADYGSVWIPAGVDRDWAPYHNGRWVWRGGEYIWVGAEPWGWAPYHYGRWTHEDNLGWCWVPPSRGDVSWGPGYVGWISTDEHVAWIPLAPRELYYGRGSYGPFSVDVRTRRPEEWEKPHDYRNLRRPGSLMVVERNSFATGRPVRMNVDIAVLNQRIAMKRGVALLGPNIKPEDGAFHASDRRVPADKAPPDRIAEARLSDLGQRRPLVRDAGLSVFKPGGKPAELAVTPLGAPRRSEGDGRGIR